MAQSVGFESVIIATITTSPFNKKSRSGINTSIGYYTGFRVKI